MKLNITSTRPRTKLDEIIEMACEATIQIYHKCNIKLTYHRYFTSVISFLSAFKHLRFHINQNYKICIRGEYCFIVVKEIKGNISYISMDIDYCKSAILLCELIKNDKIISRNNKYIKHVFSNNVSFNFYRMEKLSIIESLKVINKVYCDKVGYHELKCHIYVDENVISTNLLLSFSFNNDLRSEISDEFLFLNGREILSWE